MSEKRKAKARPVITAWPSDGESGAKRAHIAKSGWMGDWFVGFGKDESCQFEGTWWDMVCFARNVLASENTRISVPEFYRPDWKIHNYTGEEATYEFKEASERG